MALNYDPDTDGKDKTGVFYNSDDIDIFSITTTSAGQLSITVQADSVEWATEPIEVSLSSASIEGHEGMWWYITGGNINPSGGTIVLSTPPNWPPDTFHICINNGGTDYVSEGYQYEITPDFY